MSFKITVFQQLERTIKVWNQRCKDTPVELEKYTRVYNENFTEYNLIIKGKYGIQNKINMLVPVEAVEEKAWNGLASRMLESLELSGIANDLMQTKKLREEKSQL